MTGFVVGCLARSGSAWLSTALNTICPGLYVEHEGFGKALRDNTPIAFNGSVGSDVIIPSIRDTIPDGWKHYLILRWRGEVEASLRRIGIFNQDAWEASDIFIENYVRRFNPTEIAYESLYEAAIDIARDMGYAVGPIEIAKLKQLANMRITSKTYGEGR